MARREFQSEQTKIYTDAQGKQRIVKEFVEGVNNNTKAIDGASIIQMIAIGLLAIACIKFINGNYNFNAESIFNSLGNFKRIQFGQTNLNNFPVLQTLTKYIGVPILNIVGYISQFIVLVIGFIFG